MPTTLITFLGKTDNYAAIPYRFPDGATSPEQSNFHLALHAHLQPGKTVILGTPSSSWHGLFEHNGQTPSQYRDARNRLKKIVTDNGQRSIKEEQDLTASEQWQALAAFLGETYPGTRIGIIAYGQNEVEQLSIVRAVSEQVGEGDTLYLDITHGFRHLPMLAVLIALYLQRTKQVTIQGIFYGASELWGKDGGEFAPVLDLQGLLRIAEWVSALDQFGKDGDYGVFAGLLKKDGFPHGNALEKAAFFERNFNIPDAQKALSTAYPKLEQLTGLSGLFQDALQDSLRWHKKGGESPYARQRDRAEFFLKNRDYTRAALFAFEAYISKNMSGDYTDYAKREETRLSLNGDDFHTLRMLRNLLAHGSFKDENEMLKKEKQTWREVSSWIREEDKLRNNLAKLLKDLFA